MKAILDGQVTSMNVKDNRGGKREGAGRKPSGKRKRNYYITDQEHEEIKKLIEQIREGNQYGREHGI